MTTKEAHLRLFGHVGAKKIPCSLLLTFVSFRGKGELQDLIACFSDWVAVMSVPLHLVFVDVRVGLLFGVDLQHHDIIFIVPG